EKRLDSVHVCFTQMPDVSVPNDIEHLASIVGHRLLRARDAQSPENMHFYMYAPPLCTGEEIFWHIDLTWVPEDKMFLHPEWDHKTEVPYFLRKQAFIEGLAADPDSPAKPRQGPPAAKAEGPEPQ